ncbi:MAG TPA: hypothetical protein VF698_11595 [Thermoanaerobaculia bacterium]
MTRVSRRAFARDAIVIATGAAVLPAIAQEAPPPRSAEAEARYAWIIGKYGDRLDAQQREEIRKSLTGAQAGLEALRAYPLDNDVEPAMPFRA